MAKCLKIFTTTVAVVVPVATIVYFAVPWNPVEKISLVGSSSLQPLMTSLSNQYKGADLIVQGGGSGFGIQSVALGTADIGLASKDPYSSVKDSSDKSDGFTKEDWTSKNLKTFTIAFDNIAIVYKTSDPTNKLNITKDIMENYIYPLFAGIKQVRVNEIIPGSTDSSYLVPYARTGGSNASGTATSFLTQFQDYSPPQDSAEYEILSKGTYEGNVRSTNESNVESWDKISEEGFDGGIIYLSLSFVLENYDVITKNGYSVANVNGVDPYQRFQSLNYSLDSQFLRDYNWFSVYNIILPLSDDKVKNFIMWLYFDPTAQSIIKNLALVSVGDNSQYLKSMLYDSSVSGNINDSNFTSLFFEKSQDGSYEYSDGSIANKLNWPDDGSFGIPNSLIENSPTS